MADPKRRGASNCERQRSGAAARAWGARPFGQSRKGGNDRTEAAIRGASDDLLGAHSQGSPFDQPC
eukprot:12843397-Alexandrium_andersonii.AAC.1